MRCPHCKNRLLQKSESATKFRVKGPVIFQDNGVALAKCYWCKSDVQIQASIHIQEPKKVERYYQIC